MKVALIYDRLNKWGGAERVLLAFHKLFPDAPLYTSIYDRKKAPWADVFNVRTSFLQNFPLAAHHELYAFLMPLAFESFNFDEFDLVISVTSEAAKGIIVKPTTKHICYCLTPTRYLWSGYEEYFKNPLLRLLSKPVVLYLKFWDKIAAQRPDFYIAISKEVQSRISKYYGRESTVVYPPLSVFSSRLSANGQSVSPLIGQNRKTEKPKNLDLKTENQESITDYFLIVSRLVPYKKIELAVKTFNKLKLPLKIIGTGVEMKRLKNMGGPTVQFLGNLTDKELVGYYSGCRALVFPGIEDFGLTILEVQSFGKPVIAFRGGGALETIIDGKTGIFFNEQTVESLKKAIKQFSNLTINSKDCIENAQKYSFEKFKEELIREILK